MGEWSNLTQREKSNIIRFAIKNGVSDINTIRDTFNVYAKDSLANVDYNMAAAKASGFGSNGNGHYPDTFKKPNHPTFSDESIYHSEATPGGRWRGNTYEPSDYVLNQQGGWNNFLRGFYNQEQGTGAVPIFKGGVMLPEVTITPQYKEGGKIYIKPSKRGTFTAAATKHGKSVQEFSRQVLANKENYSPAIVRKANFARNAAHWHDGNSGTSFLNMQSSTPLERMNAFIQQQQLQKAVRKQAEKVQAQRDAKMQRRMLVKEENPGLKPVSLISAFTPIGDVEQVGLAAENAKQGNYGQAALGLGMLVLPNFLAKAIRARKISNALNKELKSNTLSQVVSDDMMDAWLAERWYKNETHSLPPRKIERFNVDPDDFGKDGIPLDYRLENNFPTTRKSSENVLIHVDNRIPIQAKREGFAPIPGYTEDAPAIWWQRNYPYYTSPTSLTAVGGHTLKVKEGNVRALEPTRRYEGAPGPVVVTEGILPYEAIESGIKINPEQTWFEREIFQKSPMELDYFKGKNLPEWFTFATGGPFYPFSFQKNPYWKTPVVRYDDGGEIRNWDNTLTGRLINYVENSDSVGWKPIDRTWEHPTLPGYDKNQIGMGVDKNKTPGYWDYIQYRPKTNVPFLTELDERLIRHNAIETANKSANARYKFAQGDVNRPKGTISPVKDAAVVSAIYNLGAGYVANGLFEDKDFMLKLFDGTDKEVVDRINQEYKKKGRNERIAKTNSFLFQK